MIRHSMQSYAMTHYRLKKEGTFDSPGLLPGRREGLHSASAVPRRWATSLTKNLYLHMTSREKVLTHTHTHTHAHKPLTLSDIRRQKTNPPYPIVSNSDLSLFSLLSSLSHTHTRPTRASVPRPRLQCPVLEKNWGCPLQTQCYIVSSHPLSNKPQSLPGCQRLMIYLTKPSFPNNETVPEEEKKPRV